MLYAFVDTLYLDSRDPARVAGELCDGGADLIQLRAKGCPADHLLRLAEVVVQTAQRAEVGVVINDHPDVARRVGALACHLGQEDFFDAGFERAIEVTGEPPSLRLGLSTHAPAQALRALAARPDYIAIGPVYSTPTKQSARPVTLDYVRWAAAQVMLPWFAIGGITLDNLDEVLEAGARRVCVVSAILKASNVRRACQQFKERLVSAAKLRTSN